jgi:H+/gluconate symporter-like permease
MKRFQTCIYGSLLSMVFLILNAGMTMAQSPSHLPRKKPEPIGFFDSIENTIMFVVIPIIIAILYFIWKRNNAKMIREKKESGEV